MSKPLHIVVVGGSVAGLSAALMLAEAGHRCTVLERDGEPAPEASLDAFAAWHRPGVPQLRHSHAFLARLRKLFQARLPAAYDRLLGAGSEEIGVAELFAPTIENPSPQPGDEDLVMLACRRATFEWALWREALAHASIEIRTDARVVGLATTPDRPDCISGVRLAGGPPILGDLVVDASGRHTRAPRWLAAAGRPEPKIERAESGIFYCSRFYRAANVATERRDLAVAVDLGFLKFAVFHGDSGIFSVTLAGPPDDPELATLRTGDSFDRATRLLPQVHRFTRTARPVSRVYTMAGLDNVRRSYEPEATRGFVAIGDAALHTNPLYGRGCTMALIHAALLVDAIAAHGAGAALGPHLEKDVDRELAPWFDFACRQDRDGIEHAQSHRDKAPRPEVRPDGTLDPKAYMRALVKRGLLPVMRRDAWVARKAFRGFHMLDPPASLMNDPEVMKRVLAEFRSSPKDPAELGAITRASFVAALGGAE